MCASTPRAHSAHARACAPRASQAIRHLWDDHVELPGNVVGPKIGAVGALAHMYETSLKALPIFQVPALSAARAAGCCAAVARNEPRRLDSVQSAAAVTFDDTWGVLESKMVEIVRKTECAAQHNADSERSAARARSAQAPATAADSVHEGRSCSRKHRRAKHR
jgi:hypothetical protein